MHNFFEALQLAGNDPVGGVRYFSGNEKLYESYLYKFPQDQNFAQLTLALQNSDWPEAVRAAHTLKGLSANLALLAVMDPCTDLLGALRQSNFGCCGELYDELSQGYHKTCQVIENYKGGSL